MLYNNIFYNDDINEYRMKHAKKYAKTRRDNESKCSMCCILNQLWSPPQKRKVTRGKRTYD